jgi:leader peptidase (prepilin peptidase)/N-methyltransferase
MLASTRVTWQLVAVPVAVLGGALAGWLAYRWAASGRLVPAGPSVDGRAAPTHRPLGPPLPELAGAVLWAVVVLRFGLSAELPVQLWAVSTGLLLTIVDLREHRLPNRALAVAAVGTVGLLAVAAAVDSSWDALGRAVLAGVAAGAALLVLALVSPSGLGMGDVKLAALLGLQLGWLGWPAVLLGLLLGFLGQALIGLALLAGRRVGLRDQLPFGPALLVGAFLAALLTGAGGRR